MRKTCFPLMFLLAGTSALAVADDDIFSLPIEELGKLPVTIASGRQQAIDQAPAATTVIPATSLQAAGSTGLDQVLEGVPGLHVGVSSLGYNPIYSFRGIYTGYNPQVLMLVNGIPITSVFLGNRTSAWGGFPLEDVQRVEVIRGPGSALYGADAFAGVINVITKTADDINGTQAGVRAGTFDTRTSWIEHGGPIGPVKAAFYVGVEHSNGQNGIVQQDLQSTLDSTAFSGSPPASYAPGPVDVQNKAIDARTDLAWQDWRLRASFQRRSMGMGAGLAESLDPISRVPEDRESIDLSYDNAHWRPDWDFSSSFAFYNIDEKPANPGFYLFPPGAFGGAFPDGVIGDPSHSERHTYINTVALYSGFEKNVWRIGAGFQDDNLYKAEETKNFRLEPGPVFVPLGGLVDVTGTPYVYLTPHRRDVTYVLAQDEWTPIAHWTLTAGLRTDHYSDFGNTTNPRLALVWNASASVVLKALHGTAFRAPSFVELYNTNNPVSLGNPDLKPETMVSDEFDIGWKPASSLQTNLSLFHYRMHDIILFVPDPALSGDVAQNNGNQTGHGLELELAWDALSALRLSSTFSFQHSIDENTGEDAGLAPHRHWFNQADWRFAPLWQGVFTSNTVASRDRQPGDARPPVPDYTTVDASLRRQDIVKGLEGRLTVQNLFDRDAREPSLAPGNITYDLPLPRRTVLLQLTYAW